MRALVNCADMCKWCLLMCFPIMDCIVYTDTANAAVAQPPKARCLSLLRLQLEHIVRVCLSMKCGTVENTFITFLSTRLRLHG